MSVSSFVNGVFNPTARAEKTSAQALKNLNESVAGVIQYRDPAPINLGLLGDMEQSVLKNAKALAATNPNEAARALSTLLAQKPVITEMNGPHPIYYSPLQEATIKAMVQIIDNGGLKIKDMKEACKVVDVMSGFTRATVARNRYLSGMGLTSERATGVEDTRPAWAVEAHRKFSDFRGNIMALTKNS